MVDQNHRRAGGSCLGDRVNMVFRDLTVSAAIVGAVTATGADRTRPYHPDDGGIEKHRTPLLYRWISSAKRFCHIRPMVALFIQRADPMGELLLSLIAAVACGTGGPGDHLDYYLVFALCEMIGDCCQARCDQRRCTSDKIISPDVR